MPEVSLIVNGSLFQRRFAKINILKCLEFKLLNFSVNINNTISYIVLHEMQIQRIELHYFKKLNLLKHLKIRNNNINVIQNFTFKDLNNLYKLNLSNNSITRIESGAFVGLYSLVILDLKSNSILELDILTFRITNNIGINLTKTIKYITLQRSRFKIIKSKSFIFHNMDSIDLSYNQIAVIEIDAFYITKYITTLHLQGNRLSTIDSKIFFSLFNSDVVLLSGNNIACDCGLNWIKYHPKMMKNLKNIANKDMQCGKRQLLEYIENVNCTSNRGNLYINIYIYIIFIY